MILLDYKVDEAELAEDLHDPELPGLENEDPLLINFSYFVMPIRFVVNGVDIFTLPDGTHYATAQLIGFFSDTIKILNRLTNHESAKFLCEHSSGDIFYKRMDDQIIISGGWLKEGKTASVPLQELKQAFLDFRERAKTFLIERAPALQKNRGWKEWFPEKISPGFKDSAV